MPSAFASVDNLHRQSASSLSKSAGKNKKSSSDSSPPAESIYTWIQSANNGSSTTQSNSSINNGSAVASAIGGSDSHINHSQKPPSYRSVHASQVRKEFKSAMVGKTATMGPLYASADADATKQFLQAGLHDKRFTESMCHIRID